MALISVVIPVFNEEDCLLSLFERLFALQSSTEDDYEYIVVNDGSTDGSLQILQELESQHSNLRFISLSRNFGHEAASTAGIDHASGDAVVLIDADLQDPPELIPEMVKTWRGGVDVVYARRRRRAGETAFKKLTSSIFYRLLNKLADVDIPPDTGDFRLMDRRVVVAVRRCRENPRFMRGLVSWVGFKQDAMLYDRAERYAGHTKYNVTKLLALSWEGICGFSLVPLRVTVYIGGGVTFLSLVLTAIIVIQKLFYKMPIEGYALLACGIFFMSGVGLTTLGIIAQYIGHIFRHTQNRPLYIVDKIVGWTNDEELTLAGNNLHMTSKPVVQNRRIQDG